MAHVCTFGCICTNRRVHESAHVVIDGVYHEVDLETILVSLMD